MCIKLIYIDTSSLITCSLVAYKLSTIILASVKSGLWLPNIFVICSCGFNARMCVVLH